MVPNLLSAAMIVVPAGLCARPDAGDGEAADFDGADEALLGDAEFSVVDPGLDGVPQPTSTRQSAPARLLMRQVLGGERIQALPNQLR